MKPTQCPQCGSEEYTAYYVKPGHGDPSQTYCVCDSCEHEFDGLAPDEVITNEKIREKILDAMAIAWLNKELFKDVNDYMDCVRQVKERFND